eukprot:gnl/TRDRNA2_/TRDRNA2_144394_c0_seq1.p1 gnl/TRDRNA2_/TRDRNA2_144394_c0~~gnl/TRDRNA2_/TRDRNA2_144394_c0_seq1.p1  ORF type:complete len:136 (-),score=9.08 gnl/TRDRNA2_/TRDRNA2_144394_c0_seq1:52-459(-)
MCSRRAGNAWFSAIRHDCCRLHQLCQRLFELVAHDFLAGFSDTHIDPQSRFALRTVVPLDTLIHVESLQSDMLAFMCEAQMPPLPEELTRLRMHSSEQHSIEPDVDQVLMRGICRRLHVDYECLGYPPTRTCRET